VVLGLPRGGVPVAAQVAEALGAPLDVIIVRKLGVPVQPELAMGAIGEGGVRVLDEAVLRVARVSPDQLAAVEARERDELTRRARALRAVRSPEPLAGRIAVVVDDGLATGSTARAACQVARAHGAAGVVLAVPVAPAGWEARLAGVADECVAVATPEHLQAIGQFYDDFSQTSDAEVVACLRRNAAGRAQAAPGAGDEPVSIDAGPMALRGLLAVPPGASGIVVFAHGSGSSRLSPRNRQVAEVLQDAGLATLLFDLLTTDEEGDRSLVFDVELLAGRLLQATGWVRAQPETAALPVGWFGASTGAAAALWASTDPAAGVVAIVSRGGRPDLAWAHLPAVRTPTLLVVGGLDDEVLALNRQAAEQLRCEHRVAVVPGATHLFEEPGTLRAAAELARAWFVDHLSRAHRSPS